MTEFWDRYTKLIIKNPSSGTEKTITSDELGIYFRTKRWTSGEASESYGATIDNSVIADIGIFNLFEVITFCDHLPFLFCGKPKCKVRRKSLLISPYRLIEGSG